MKQYHVINLGAGVQSTWLYVLVSLGIIPMPENTVAGFADTKDEEPETYKHLDWLEVTHEWPRIYRRSVGKLSDSLVKGIWTKNKGTRFAKIPAFTQTPQGNDKGKTRRQCTREFKIDVIEQWIRREVVGLKPGRGLPKGVEVHQYIGISLDEARRAVGAKERIECRRGWFAHFPFLEMEILGRVGWTRGEILRELPKYVPHPVPRSACVHCPLRSDREWLDMKQNRPAAFAEACRIDEALRTTGAVANRKLEKELFLHRSCVPLAQANFNENQGTMDFTVRECQGICGV